jgi:hypothetical protein
VVLLVWLGSQLQMMQKAQSGGSLRVNLAAFARRTFSIGAEIVTSHLVKPFPFLLLSWQWW